MNSHRKLAAERKSCEFWAHLSPFTCIYPTWKTSRKILQKCSFPIWLLTLSMPHVRGCLKMSSQDNYVWSDPFCTVNSEQKKPPKLQYESVTPQPFYSLVFLQSGGLGGDEHLDHSNHSGLVSSENCRRAQAASRVDLRLGTPGNDRCETSKSSAKNAAKTSIRFLEIWPLPPGAPGLHALLNDFGINFRFDYTYTYTFNCFWN